MAWIRDGRGGRVAAVLEYSPADGRGTVPGQTIDEIRVFGIVGGAYLAACAVILVRWVTSADFHRTPPGADLPPDWLPPAMHALDAVSVGLGALVLYLLVIRPWHRTKRLPANGYLLLACFGLYPLDVLFSYVQPYFTYNAYHLNFGSWLNEVPGALAPNGHLLAQPVLAWGSGYGWCMLLPALAGSRLISWLRSRSPGISLASLFGVVWIGFIGFTAIDVLFGIALRSYVWFNVVGRFSVFDGHWYQYPLYEPVLMGFFWAVLTFVAHFRDTEGLTVAERGLGAHPDNSRGRGIRRFLAIQGLLAVLYVFTFSVPSQLFVLHADTLPRDAPSYLQGGSCGTEQPCPVRR
jgi:hypothetical protein